jgi:glyceraldehyde 3-phosphate dehydrogenase
MTIRVGINGFGRIGRLVFRVMDARDSIEVVAINDLADAKTMATLLKFDSVHGLFNGSVEVVDEGCIRVNGDDIRVTTERDPRQLPWKELDVDFVVESTGVFRKRDQIAMHLEAGAPKVLLTVPAKDDIDAMVVLGVNDDDLGADDRIVSNASCTTNCLAPLAKVLHESFGISHGLMTTTHGYTNGQRLLDMVHKDLRRARAAAVNIIPTTTGAARAVGKVLPALAGKLDGMAMRVPVPDGSCVDLCAMLDKNVTVDDVNAAVRAAAEGPMQGILQYSEDPLVSSDIVGNSHSSIFDAPSTMVIAGNFIKVISWYDNEWGYSSRVADLLVKSHYLGK